MTQSIVGLFNSFENANAAKRSLISSGINESDIVVSPQSDITSTSTSATTTSTNASGGGFMQGIENFFSSLFGADPDNAGHYTEAVRRGNAVVTVDVDDESQVDTIRAALAQQGAVNIDERVETWRNSGYTGYRKNSAPYTAAEVAEERARVIPIIKEDLEVGKRQVDLGVVRVVSRIVERPVTEQVTLREEHATIERRPVDRPASQADLAALQDQSIEIRETAEKAVVSKTAHVVEEVVVGKQETERTEQISDNVRSTVVEVDQASESQRSVLDIDQTSGTTGRSTVGVDVPKRGS